VETPSELSAEGTLRRVERWCGEAGFATGGNAPNPRIGSGMKQACEVEEEQAVEVVRNHEDGTREGVATLSEGCVSIREWTLQRTSMKGRSLDKPKRGTRRGNSSGRKDRKVPGKTARRSGGSSNPTQSGGSLPDRRSLEGEGRYASKARAGFKAVEGDGEGQRAMTSIGSFPRGCNPSGSSRGADPVAAQLG
jgi:hypothetical protein